MKLTTKLVLALVVILSAQFSFGQYSVNKQKKSYFGVLGGFSYSFSKVTDRYSVLTSTEENENLEKTYSKGGDNKGAQFGIRYNYNFTNLISVSAGFGYQTLGFNYRTQYSWIDTAQNQNFNREMHHLQKVSYFTVPIMARWDMTESQFKPYVQGGLFMDFRHQANKVIHYDNTIDEQETENEISSSALVSITDNTRKFNMGLMGGVGLSYYTKYFAVGVESNFRFGWMKVVNDDTRYADLNGFALKYLDVLDQLKLSTLNVQFTLSVPISNSVAANIMRRKRYNRKR